jgi:hypothetical protein
MNERKNAKFIFSKFFLDIHIWNIYDTYVMKSNLWNCLLLLLLSVLSVSVLSCGNSSGSSSGNPIGGPVDPPIKNPLPPQENIPYDDSKDDGSDYGWLPDNADIYGSAFVRVEPNRLISLELVDIHPKLYGNVISVEQTGGVKVAFTFSSVQTSLNFISPKDAGFERNLTFVARTDNEGDIPFRIIVRTRTDYIWSLGDLSCKGEDDEIDEECNNDPMWGDNIELIGVHNVNIWKAREGVLGLKLITHFTPTEFSVVSNGEDISEMFEYNSIDKTISLKYSDRDKFKSLQNIFGEIYLEVGAASADNAMLPFGIFLLVGDSKITGRVLWDNGSIAKEAFNLPIIFHNQDSDKHFVYNIDSVGGYEADNLPAGIYTITSGDIKARYELMGSAELKDGDNLILEHRLIDFGNFNASSNTNSVPLTKAVSSTIGLSSYRVTNSRVTDSRVTEERRRLIEEREKSGSVKTADIKPNDYEQVGDTNCYWDNETGAFQVVSAFDNLTKSTCKDNITVKSGTNLLGVTMTVRTEEYIPLSTSYLPILSPLVEYEYQDVWGFSFKVDNISFKEGGSVAKDNTNKDAFGVAGNSTLRFDYCVNVKKLAARDNVTIPFMLYAQDKGDANVPTDITIQTTSGCNFIKEFTQYKDHNMMLYDADRDINFSSPRLKVGFPFLSKDESPVISFILDNSSKVFYDIIKMPIKLQYKMDNNTKIKDSSLYLVLGGKRTKIMDNFTNQFPPKPNARDNITYTLEWDNFTFPAIPRSIYDSVKDIDSDDNATIRLEAEINFISKKEKEDKSVSTHGVSLYSTIKGDNSLVPLFELRDVYIDNTTDIEDRKYGRPEENKYENDKGGDLWGRKAFLQWVMNDSKLIFNDLSSIHGARFIRASDNKNRSILDHSGHTSGMEIDIRYANPIEDVSNTDNLTKDSFVYYPYDNYSGYQSGNLSEPGSIINLSKRAKDEYDNDTITVKTNLNIFKDWIKTNRLMMEYYYDNLTESFGSSPTIYYGDNLSKQGKRGFYKMMYNGSFYDNDTSVAGKWNNTRTKIRFLDPHHDHWHITAPVRR